MHLSVPLDYPLPVKVEVMTARDEYPTARFLVSDEPPTGRGFDNLVHHEINAMFDEIDRLRLLNGRLERDFADMNKVRFCDATHPDTECAGWLWCCSLIVGHLGPHRCAGASW